MSSQRNNYAKTYTMMTLDVATPIISGFTDEHLKDTYTSYTKNHRNEHYVILALARELKKRGLKL